MANTDSIVITIKNPQPLSNNIYNTDEIDGAKMMQEGFNLINVPPPILSSDSSMTQTIKDEENIVTLVQSESSLANDPAFIAIVIPDEQKQESSFVNHSTTSSTISESDDDSDSTTNQSKCCALSSSKQKNDESNDKYVDDHLSQQSSPTSPTPPTSLRKESRCRRWRKRYCCCCFCECWAMIALCFGYIGAFVGQCYLSLICNQANIDMQQNAADGSLAECCAADATGTLCCEMGCCGLDHGDTESCLECQEGINDCLLTDGCMDCASNLGDFMGSFFDGLEGLCGCLGAIAEAFTGN